MLFDIASALPLVGAGLIAGFINTIAGGGSLLTLPALMLVGLPADVANGTNRVGIFLQAVAAVLGFGRRGKLPWPLVRWVMAPTIVGAVIGAFAASWVPESTLEPVLLVTLCAVALFLVVRPAMFTRTPADEPVSTNVRWSAVIQLFVAGLYAGFIQAGLGFVLLAILCGGLRLDLVRANAMKALIVGLLTVAALGVFIAHDLVAWLPGVLLGVAGMTGAWLGVRFTVSINPRILRSVILVAVIAACAVIGLR